MHFTQLRMVAQVGIAAITLLEWAAVTGCCGADCQAASLADQFQVIKQAWNDEVQLYRFAIDAAGPDDVAAVILRPVPDKLRYWRQVVELAGNQPDDAASRDALRWVVHWPGLPAQAGESASVEAFAMRLLLKHHADDKVVVKVCLPMTDGLSPNREMFVRGMSEAARDRALRGHARLAMAIYLLNKCRAAQLLERADSEDAMARTAAHAGEAYRRYLQQSGSKASTDEAVAILDDLAMNYGDVRFERDGGERLKRRRTLGEAAESLLDEVRNLAIGRPLPEISGPDMHGNSMRLSDYRGKVVVVVFWVSWCGPCVADMKQERELAERLRGRPFVILGVNCDADRSAAADTIKAEQIGWRNWSDPITVEGEGPIADRLHVRQLPSTYVLDEHGIIRARNVRSDKLDEMVERLVNAAENPSASPKPK